MPVPPPLQLDDPAGRHTRELRWTNQEVSLINIIPLWFSILIIWGMNNRPSGGHSSETLSHLTDMMMMMMIIIIIIIMLYQNTVNVTEVSYDFTNLVHHSFLCQ
jgi:hypothetical protein